MANDGNVHAFACGLPHPVHGEQHVCTRQRAHPGDHRSVSTGRLLNWSDAPYDDTVDVLTDEGPEPVATFRGDDDRLEDWRASLQPPYPDGSLYAPRTIPRDRIAPALDKAPVELKVTLTIGAESLAWLVAAVAVLAALVAAAVLYL